MSLLAIALELFVISGSSSPAVPGTRLSDFLWLSCSSSSYWLLISVSTGRSLHKVATP